MLLNGSPAGPVVTNLRTSGAIDAGNGHIYGTATTGPGGTVTYNGGGTVGDTTWSATHSGVQPGYASDTMNNWYPDPAAPDYSSVGPLLQPQEPRRR